VTTTFATRTRPFTSPHPIPNIQADAIKRRDLRHKERSKAIKSPRLRGPALTTATSSTGP
jgi:hypothetical protein